MTTGALVWMVIFWAAALLFFGIAAVVSVKGFADLKELLGEARKEGG